jgi:hypothetical protein
MSRPVSDANQLYIPIGNFGTINMDDLLERACSHFGCVTIDEVTISPENLKVDGCSCCYDSSDYEMYLCVTVNKD